MAPRRQQQQQPAWRVRVALGLLLGLVVGAQAFTLPFTKGTGPTTTSSVAPAGPRYVLTRPLPGTDAFAKVRLGRPSD